LKSGTKLAKKGTALAEFFLQFFDNLNLIHYNCDVISKIWPYVRGKIIENFF
jgi:hypothetical protein